MNPLSKVICNSDMENITQEFKRLKHRCYLDNTGAVLYPQKLIDSVREDLTNNIYMNPHTDKHTKDSIEHVRSLILNHFNTDFTNYSVIFTSGATQSMKLLVESFRFGSSQEKSLKQGAFVYLQDNHTSVIGLREIADDRNAEIVHMQHEEFLNSIANKSNIYNEFDDKSNTLFVYPAQSNFNGFKYPIDSMDDIKTGCLNNVVRKQWKSCCNNWYVLLDAASYVGTNKLDLSKNPPDFVCVSFYKMFGYPTGLGALLVKKSSEHVLGNKRYFGGGTIDIVLSSEDFHVKKTNIQERFEDGTVSFLSILKLKHCFDVMHELIPKTINNDLMETISYHTFYLAKDLYEQLQSLKHNNGTSAVILYMDSDFSNITKQGGIVTFNLIRDNGSYIGYNEFQHMADLFEISIRTGCFCNSGTCQRHFQRTNDEVKQAFNSGHSCSNGIDLLNGHPTGAIRVSFAYYNTFDDVDRLVKMICRCFVNTQFVLPKRSMVTNDEMVLDKTATEVKTEMKINGIMPLMNGYKKYMNGLAVDVNGSA